MHSPRRGGREGEEEAKGDRYGGWRRRWEEEGREKRSERGSALETRIVFKYTRPGHSRPCLSLLCRANPSMATVWWGFRRPTIHSTPLSRFLVEGHFFAFFSTPPPRPRRSMRDRFLSRAPPTLIPSLYEPRTVHPLHLFIALFYVEHTFFLIRFFVIIIISINHIW